MKTFALPAPTTCNLSHLTTEDSYIDWSVRSNNVTSFPTSYTLNITLQIFCYSNDLHEKYTWIIFGAKFHVINLL